MPFAESKRRRRRIAGGIAAAYLGLAVVAGCLHVASTAPQEWNRSRLGPLVPHTTFPGDCSLCHVLEDSTTLREDFEFDHEAQTGYALEGAHARATCLRCHNDRGPVTEYLARGCGGCHMDPHESTLDPDCTECHNQMSWRPVGLLAQHDRTRFPLIGAHVGVACYRCHPGAPQSDYIGAPVECHLCHADELPRATDPDHIANGFVVDCQRCHAPARWERGILDHERFFPYRSGDHRGLECSECRTTGDTRTFSCIDCHEHRHEEMDDEHEDVRGYVYESNACFMCHPRGRE